MAFELYEGRNQRPQDVEPRVSIWKFGMIAFNRAAMEHWVKDADAAQLFYDAEGGRVAVKPCAKGTPHAYALQHTKAGGTINAKSFLTYHNQTRKSSEHFVAEWNDELKAVVFAVGKAPAAGKAPTARSKEKG